MTLMALTRYISLGRTVLATIGLTTLILISACSSGDDAGQGDGRVADFSRIKVHTTEELEAEAEAIVVVTVVDQGEGSPVLDGVELARHTVRIEQSLKGALKVGDEVSTVYTSVPASDRYPDLVEGTEFLLFLKPYLIESANGGESVETDELVLVGDWSGMYSVDQDGSFSRLDDENDLLAERLTVDTLRSLTADS